MVFYTMLVNYELLNMEIGRELSKFCCLNVCDLLGYFDEDLSSALIVKLTKILNHLRIFEHYLSKVALGHGLF